MVARSIAPRVVMKKTDHYSNHTRDAKRRDGKYDGKKCHAWGKPNDGHQPVACSGAICLAHISKRFVSYHHRL